MFRLALHAAAACAILVPAPVLAQAEDPASSEEPDTSIVVTGELPSHLEVTRQAREITVPTGIRYLPLPRFEGDRLCPGVIGLKDDYAALVIDRIRANAERFDLWMTEDDGTCQPNFIVAFVDDGKATLQQIANQWEGMFRGMPRPERLALLDEEGPVRVWTLTATRAPGGMPIGEDPRTGTKVVTTSAPPSRFYLSVREDITGVLVLFDRAAVRGMTLVQLADYATMRGLARTRPVDGDGQALDTILALFDPEATPPVELTQFDRAYLGALYAGMPNQTGLTKVLNVTTQLRRQAREERAAAGE